MKVRLESGLCQGHAQCHAVDPNLFPIDDAGYVIVDEMEVESADAAVVLEAVAACPEQALVIEGD